MEIMKIKNIKIKKTLSLPHLKRCGLFGFSGCSEIETPRLHPLTKVSSLISDIINFQTSKFAVGGEQIWK